MMNESKQNTSDLSLDALKGMQSVRATFTLPKTTINLISTVASQLGVKQKSIFDHLVEDTERFGRIADEARHYHANTKQREQKTFVLSKSSLGKLEAFAKTHQLPRDLLVEYTVKQLHPVVAQEKKQHENRKTLLKEMETFQKQGIRFMNKARSLVGNDDEAVQSLEAVFSQYDKSVDALKIRIDKGRCMEDFP